MPQRYKCQNCESAFYCMSCKCCVLLNTNSWLGKCYYKRRKRGNAIQNVVSTIGTFMWTYNVLICIFIQTYNDLKF